MAAPGRTTRSAGVAPPRRGTALGRSKREWGVRISAAVALAILAVPLLARSLASITASHDPVRAHQLAPRDGRIAGRAAAALFTADPTTAIRRGAQSLAEQALATEPTTADAAATLGLVAQMRDDTVTAHQWFRYAQTLSRRNFATQLWYIEYSVGRGDILDALRHYDIALRTEPASADILFPVLATAAADPAIRHPLVRLLTTKPNWGGNFVSHMAASGPDARVTASLFDELGRERQVIPDEDNARLIAALLDHGQAERAWTYYASIRSGASRDASRDPEFTATLRTASRFDWVVGTGDGLTVTLQQGASGGLLEFAAAPSVGGLVIQQTQMLHPGAYRLVGRASNVTAGSDAVPYWALSCADGRELGRVALPLANQSDGAFVGRFVVPPDCLPQLLSLVARPVSQVEGMSGQVGRVMLMPVR